MSTQDTDRLESFLRFNIEAAKFKLKTIKNDFYIDRNVSRYNSTIDTESKVLNILSKYVLKYSNEMNLKIDGETVFEIDELKFEKYETYDLDFFYERFKAISFLPLSLFNITCQFIFELEKIMAMVEMIKESNQINPKIKWNGIKTHIGFIIGSLADNGYIEPPRNKNGEINYTAFAKLIKQNFEIDITDDTLRKYLNPNDDKFVENKRIFDKKKFHLPHKKLIS